MFIAYDIACLIPEMCGCFKNHCEAALTSSFHDFGRPPMLKAILHVKNSVSVVKNKLKNPFISITNTLWGSVFLSAGSLSCSFRGVFRFRKQFPLSLVIQQCWRRVCCLSFEVLLCSSFCGHLISISKYPLFKK